MKNRDVISAETCGSTGSNRLRRDWTCSRARCAICRTAATERPTAAAISSWPKPNTSRSTNTARSSGLSVSSTTSIAIDTDSASTTSADASGPVSSGSGSHGPMYCSRRRDWARSVLRACRVTSWAR